MVVVLMDHETVSTWFPVLINSLRVVPFDLEAIVASFSLILIANEIAPSGSGIDRSQDCFCVVPCFDEQVEDHAL